MKYVLDVPYMYRAPGVRYDSGLKTSVYEGDSLPASLARFAPGPFTYGEWVQNALNGTSARKRAAHEQFTPMEHQKTGAKAILDAYRKGDPGLLLADTTGLGKTLSALLGVTLAARASGKKTSKVLIVCPKRVIPVWQQTIESLAISQDYSRFLIINYEQLSRLVSPPKTQAMRKAKKARTKNRMIANHGKPKVAWDFVVFDEAHTLKNYGASTVSLLAANVARLNEPYQRGTTPFTVFATATPGSSPLNFAIMAGLFSPFLSTDRKRVTPNEWGAFLESRGFHVTEGKTGYRWASVSSFDKNSDDPQKRRAYQRAQRAVAADQREDVRRIGRALTDPQAPFIRRKPEQLAGWPEQQLIPYPVELEQEARPIYEAAWSRFRDWMKLPGARNDPQARLVETLRYRQKASFLKAEAMAEMMVDVVEQGQQVYAACFFSDTIEKLGQILTKRKIPWTTLTGKLSDEEATANRLAFQKGEAKVIMCSVVEGISLHAGETLPDGTKATTAPRVSIIFDVRGDPNKAVQSLGRAHRNGQNSVTYFPYFIGTVEKDDVARFVKKYGNMMTMTGEEAGADELAETFQDTLDDM